MNIEGSDFKKLVTAARRCGAQDLERVSAFRVAQQFQRTLVFFRARKSANKKICTQY
jgi:hypothetical protein